jgi:ubiquinone biosynthesis protein COQ4
MTEQPFIHPDRPELRWRPFKAVQHFRNLIADKEDTEQVFHIFQCLPRKAFRGEAVEFLKTDFGQALKEREPFLPDLLDDHDRLRAMPIGYWHSPMAKTHLRPIFSLLIWLRLT